MGVYGSGAYGLGAYGAGAGGAPTAASALPAVVVEVAFASDPFASRLVAVFSLASVTSGQPNFLYVDQSAVDDYTIQPGDVLEYDIYWPGASQWVGFDIENATWSLRGATATDQNGVSSHPNTDLTARANGVWYHRTIPLTSTSSVPGGSIASDGAGQTITKFMLAMDHTGTGAAQGGTAYLRDVVITNGGLVAKRIWGQLDAPPTAPSLAVAYAAPASGSTLAVSKAKPLETIVWTDIAGDVLEIDTQRGRQHELDRIEAGTGTLSLDNQLRRYDRTNITLANALLNPRFAVDLSNWATQTVAITGATATRVTTDGRYGSTSVELSGTSTSAGAGLYLVSPTPASAGTAGLPVVPGQTVYVRGSMKRVSGGDSSTLLLLLVNWYDAAGVPLSMSTPAASQQLNPTAGTWYDLASSVVAPANAAYCQFGFGVNQNNNLAFTVRGSAGQIVVGADPAKKYVDGSVDPLARWAGEPNASPTYWGSYNALPMRRCRVRALWPRNYITNASFETDLSGWALTNPAAHVTATRDTTQHVDGGASMKLVNTTAGEDAYESIKIFGLKPNSRYTFSAYVNVTAFTSGAISNRGLYAIPFQAVGGALSDYNVANQVSANITAVTAGFVRLSVTVATGPLDAGVEVRLYAPQATVYWDAAQLEDGAAASGFMGSGVWYYLFSGFVERWPSTQSGRMSQVDVTLVDALAALSDVTINKFYASDFSGSQIAAILSDSGWPIEDRIVDVGDSQVQPVSAATGGTEIQSLSRIQDNADAEVGLFFADARGNAVFQHRLARIQPPLSISAGTFYDAPPTPDSLLYLAPVPSFDTDNVYNYVSVTPAAASTPSIAEDLVSQRQYGRKSLIRTPVVLTTSEANSQAYYLLSRYAQPSLRYDSIVIPPKRNSLLWPHVLGRELSDRITIVRTPVGGGPTTTKDVHIESVGHSIRAARGDSAATWSTTWSVSPADVQSYWTLAGAGGDAWSANSILGQTTRLAY